ncbi:MAG: diguanylate cyclase domain-containing protein [Acidimicrobiales bacterium]
MPAEIERYAEVLGLAPIGCLLVEQGIIRKANSEAIETMGIPSDRLVGVPLAELLVPEYEAACLDLLHRAAIESDTGTKSEPVRLARGLAPMELMARGMSDELVMVGVRSMANEHYYSAQAGGALTHDTVTGFPDHYHVLSQLHERLAAPHKKPLALMCLWIDELPDMAETYGKRAVHRVMREAGQRIQERLRGPDVLGRFDEAGFLVMMSSDSTPEQLTDIAERLRAEVAFPVELDRGLVSFTASVVVGSITNQRPSIERVLALLEAAANRAANSGGNRTDYLSI